MRFPDCMRLPNAENTFAGFPIAQTWTDLALWEEFLNRHKLGSLVELGTWRGGMAAFLAVQAKARGITFMSVDHQAGQVQSAEFVERLGGCVLTADIFEPGFMAQHVLRMPKPLLLFCDNGSKRQELNVLASQVSKGDFIAVHDWGSEACIDDICPLWRPLLETECESSSSITRFFQVPLE